MNKDNRKEVAKSSETFFVNGMNGHNAVKEVLSLGEDLYILKRNGRPNLKILIADIYIAGEADIYEINPGLFDIDAIILVGFYNRYSVDAKRLAKNMNIGLFDNREFFGAINYSGDNFVNYERKEETR